MANSSILVLPKITAPAFLSRLTTVASYGAMNWSSIFDEQVVRVSCMQMRSFKAIGMPRRGASWPAASFWSAS